MTREERLPFMGGVLTGLIIALVTILVSETITDHPWESPPVAAKPDECKGISAGQVWEYVGGRENPFDTHPLRSVSKVLEIRGRYVRYEVLPGGDMLPKIDSDSCWWFTLNRKPLP